MIKTWSGRATFKADMYVLQGFLSLLYLALSDMYAMIS